MSFLSLRSRLLQTLILALVGLTFYTYYRTTASELQQYAFVRSYNRTSFYEQLHSHANSSISIGSSSSDVPSTPLSRNLTSTELGASSSNPTVLVNLNNASHNLNYGGGSNGNLSTVITVVSSSSSSSSTNSAAAGFKLTSSTSTTTTTTTTTTTVAPSTSPVIDKDSARAIYVPGHTVAVPEKCPDFGKFMELMIIIMSAPTHFEARTAIRQTWGHFGQRRDIGIVFMLGATNDVKFERNLEKEQDMYGDIIRGRFLDSYSNLTLKTISTLEWVDNYCSEVRYVLKTDDDMFINVPRLVSFINKHKRDKNVIFGKLAKKWKPVRSKSSKYFVSLAQYKNTFYPDFCTGPAYLMSSDIIHNLYESALNETFLKLEDVFATGIVASKLGIKRIHANEFLNRKISYSPCNVQRGISIHMVKYSEQFDLWKKLLDGKTKCK